MTVSAIRAAGIAFGDARPDDPFSPKLLARRSFSEGG